MSDKDQLIGAAVASLADGFVLPADTVRWARTGPMPDEPQGYKYIPAPEHVHEMMRNRFDGGRLTAIDQTDSNVFLHGVENFWDGPHTVRRFETQIALEYIYVHVNPWTKQADVFDEYGYFNSTTGEFNPW